MKPAGFSILRVACFETIAVSSTFLADTGKKMQLHQMAPENQNTGGLVGLWPSRTQ